MPLILAGPGVPRGREERGLAMVADVAPTILGLVGDSSPTTFDGIDLASAVDHPEVFDGRLTFAGADWRNEEPDIKRMVRNLRYKLTYDRNSKETTLYDLVHDPEETEDLSGKETRKVEALRKCLEGFMKGDRAGAEAAPRSPEELRHLEELGY